MITDSLLGEEYNPYYNSYINLVSESKLGQALNNGKLETFKFFRNIPKEKLSFRYAPGKWTPLEILQHIIDTERVFAYRALFIARAKPKSLQGFDQDEFVSNTSNLDIETLLKEYEATRAANVLLFNSFDSKTLKRVGVASESKLSVRAAGFIICGHEIHHINVMKERYL